MANGDIICIFHYSVLVVVSIVIFAYTEKVNTAVIDVQTLNTSPNKSEKFMFPGINSNRVLYESDMMLSAEQYTAIKDENYPTMLQIKEAASREKRKAVRNLANLWPNKAVPYKIERGIFTYGEIREIHKAMDQWRDFTCIQFRRATRQDEHFVTFFSEDGCWSYIGFFRKIQNKISLGNGCRSKDTIIHEIGHTIGFFHEHNRPDRDNHIRVLEKNINDEGEGQFDKKSTGQVETYGLPYDYISIMHYGEDDFSKNKQPTIVTKDSKYQKLIGKSQGLSFFDIKLANLMYRCGDQCPKVTCPGHGFVGKDCKCWCPGEPVKLCDMDIFSSSEIEEKIRKIFAAY